MPARYSKFFRATHILGDVLLLNFSFFVVNTIYYENILASFNDHYIKQFLYINLFWLIVSTVLKIYDINRVMRFEKIYSSVLKAVFLHNLLIFAFVVIFKEYIYSVTLYVGKYLVFVFLITSWRLAFYYFLKFLRKHGLNFRNVIVIGSGPIGEDIYNFFLKHPEHGYRFLGFFDESYPGPYKFKDITLGKIDDCFAFAKENNVDEIYCSLPDVDNEKVKTLMDFSDKNLIRLKLLPDFSGILYKKVEINFYDRTPVLILRQEPLENTTNRVLKRAFDILFSLLVILFIFPWLFFLIALLVKLSSKGPVFFKQLRSGKDNNSFWCYKFRSMHVNNFSDQVQAQKGDVRITRTGRFLRKTNLDELPQFINVLLGNMSVVGPRPHMLKHTEEYSKIVDRFMVRHFVKPGVTGMAQAKGFRGETTDPLLMQKRVQYDVWYIENWSFFLDIKIIALTVWTMIKGDQKAF